MTKDEALKLALPLLEDCVNSYRLKYERPAFDKAIAAIKKALAQEQEPVTWPDWFNHAFPSGELEAVGFRMPTPRAFAEEMYKRWKRRFEELSTPPQRKPLTDEDIEDLYFDKFSMSELKAFARAIEAAHGIKEKNT